MASTSKIGYLLERVSQGVAAHDRENPDHHTWGIGMAYFDIERLGPRGGRGDPSGDRAPGRRRHDRPVPRSSATATTARAPIEEEEEVVEAIASEEIAEPAHAPGPGPAPQIKPPF